jgi:hypothetical protein
MSNFSEAWLNTIPPPTLAFRAQTGDKEAFGKTVGEALDEIVQRLTEHEDNTLVIIEPVTRIGSHWLPGEDSLHVIVKRNKPDRFFTQEQRQRLTELMRKLNDAREGEAKPTSAEMLELEELVEAELEGAMKRAKANLGGLAA